MLELLAIKHVALIDDMRLEFSQGMNVLTGETGAGKSFILKALSFLMGDKLGTDMVRPGHERAQVEALFALPSGDVIIRRELMAESGRSRLYINDQLSSQETIRALKEELIVYTSQHGQQRLLQSAYQASLIDDWMEKSELLQNFKLALQEYNGVVRKQEELVAKVHDLTDKKELFEMQLEKIKAVDPYEGEEEELEEARARARLLEKQNAKYDQALQCLYGNDSLIDRMGELARLVGKLAEDDEGMSEYAEGLSSSRDLLLDLSTQLHKRPASDDFDSKNIDIDAIESRLYALAKLKRSLNRTMPEILAFQESIEANLSFLDACGLEEAQLKKANDAAREHLATLLESLNSERLLAAESFTKALETVLHTLGFSEHVRVFVNEEEHELCPPAPSGKPCIEKRLSFLWAPNPGQTPQRLDRIASGGELSRFMLAVVSLQHKNSHATLIFDEVDAGVGGITLNRVAEVLYELASHRQMLLVTHWPQLATQAKRHFYVYKTVVEGSTYTRCEELVGEKRERELQRMAGIE